MGFVVIADGTESRLTFASLCIAYPADPRVQVNGLLPMDAQGHEMVLAQFGIRSRTAKRYELLSRLIRLPWLIGLG